MKTEWGRQAWEKAEYESISLGEYWLDLVWSTRVSCANTSWNGTCALESTCGSDNWTCRELWTKPPRKEAEAGLRTDTQTETTERAKSDSFESYSYIRSEDIHWVPKRNSYRCFRTRHMPPGAYNLVAFSYIKMRDMYLSPLLVFELILVGDRGHNQEFWTKLKRPPGTEHHWLWMRITVVLDLSLRSYTNQPGGFGQVTSLWASVSLSVKWRPNLSSCLGLRAPSMSQHKGSTCGQ